MNSYNLKTIENTLNKIHPKQIINKVDSFSITLHEANYEYTTVRGNKKQGTKYFLLNTLNPQANIEKELNGWVNNYNIENKHRQISNVKFLDSQCLGFINI
ncbi:hypothetical protein [Clostridium botulinum]|uniref:hypothetical protein n=1 Tax=Clostridium botulinum TaxID=1491 RepID=UPI00174808B1|nr:hypothetical protein [Clostridium botulinum]MBD5589102.1 hypothetical protein [Clostridium botulinum]MBY6842853.1 hypothetical protein [Clostridium botulinum]